MFFTDLGSLSSNSSKNLVMGSWSNIVKFSNGQAYTQNREDNIGHSDIGKSLGTKVSKGIQLSKGKIRETKTDDAGTVKKVKKKDPITLDLLQVIQVR